MVRAACLWSPHQMTRHLRGVRATAEASSRLPYCCPSSLRATSASSIHVATGLYGCWHSWWKPPPHPMPFACVPATLLMDHCHDQSEVALPRTLQSSSTPRIPANDIGFYLQIHDMQDNASSDTASSLFFFFSDAAWVTTPRQVCHVFPHH